MKSWFWKLRVINPEDQAITDSIKSLKTLSCRDGRVSIDPREVIDQPGYSEARRDAAALVRGTPRNLMPVNRTLQWSDINELGLTEWASLAVRSLCDSQAAGRSYPDAVDRLKRLAMDDKR